MIYPSIDKLLNTVDSKYQLVHIAAKRSRQMTETGHYQLKKYNSEKNIGKALEEIAAGLIKVKVTTK
jgi:DNA-directed RNA polymerase subunit omega